MSCFDLTHAPVATAARAAATAPVSMSTRPGPEGSGTVEIDTTSRYLVLVALNTNRNTNTSVRVHPFFSLFQIITFTFQLNSYVGFTLSDLLDKPWSQVSSLPPGTCLQFLFERSEFLIDTPHKKNLRVCPRARVK